MSGPRDSSKLKQLRNQQLFDVQISEDSVEVRSKAIPPQEDDNMFDSFEFTSSTQAEGKSCKTRSVTYPPAPPPSIGDLPGSANSAIAQSRADDNNAGCALAKAISAYHQYRPEYDAAADRHTAAEEAFDNNAYKAAIERALTSVPPPVALVVDRPGKWITATLMVHTLSDGSEERHDIGHASGTLRGDPNLAGKLVLETRGNILEYCGGDAETAKPLLKALRSWDRRKAAAAREAEKPFAATLTEFRTAELAWYDGQDRLEVSRGEILAAPTPTAAAAVLALRTFLESFGEAGSPVTFEADGACNSLMGMPDEDLHAALNYAVRALQRLADAQQRARVADSEFTYRAEGYIDAMTELATARHMASEGVIELSPEPISTPRDALRQWMVARAQQNGWDEVVAHHVQAARKWRERLLTTPPRTDSHLAAHIGAMWDVERDDGTARHPMNAEGYAATASKDETASPAARALACLYLRSRYVGFDAKNWLDAYRAFGGDISVCVTMDDGREVEWFGTQFPTARTERSREMEAEVLNPLKRRALANIGGA